MISATQWTKEHHREGCNMEIVKTVPTNKIVNTTNKYVLNTNKYIILTFDVINIRVRMAMYRLSSITY